MRILVADDNPVFRSVLKAILSNWGYEVVTANDGDEALASLECVDGPRLAILDWMMPGMHGTEVCRRVRVGVRPGYVYMLVLTAKTQLADLVMAMEAGADDYVTKPFKSQELLARLRTGCRILSLEDRLVLAHQQAAERYAVPLNPPVLDVQLPQG